MRRMLIGPAYVSRQCRHFRASLLRHFLLAAGFRDTGHMLLHAHRCSAPAGAAIDMPRAAAGCRLTSPSGAACRDTGSHYREGLAHILRHYYAGNYGHATYGIIFWPALSAPVAYPAPPPEQRRLMGS